MSLTVDVKKKTKVVCTIGPSSDSEEVLRKLILAGMNVVRLNFSHGSREEHKAKVDIVRKLSKELGIPVGLLQDLQGPKIRIGKLKQPIPLKVGEVYKFASLEHAEGHDDIIPVQYPGLHEDLRVNDTVLLADGVAEVEVVKIEGTTVHCKMLVNGLIDGVLTSNKGVNMPKSDLKIPAITDADKENLKFGLEMGVNFVAFSFVRKADDMDPALEMINKIDPIHRPLVLAKIEKPQAVKDIDHILDKVDGIMVARGDLGVECPLEQVPAIQKTIIKKANAKGKFVITATQMLKSMVDSPVPTRAEVSDVANAIIDGTDAVMLSEESAMGNYPVESCTYLTKVSKDIEQHYHYYQEHLVQHDMEIAVGRAAASIAKVIHPAAIVAFTAQGKTAKMLSKLRAEVPVIALSPNEDVVAKLNLYWNVTPIKVETVKDSDAMVEVAGKVLLDRGIARKGDKFILVAGVPLGVVGGTNLVRVVVL